MNKLQVKEDLVTSLGTLLTNGVNGSLETSNDFGDFICTVENFGDFGIVRRNFQTNTEAVSIPFSSRDLSVQMIFSLNGQSAFKNRLDPLRLRPFSHSLNFFEYYDCKNLLAENFRQHDITFRLKKEFYHHFLASSTFGSRVSEMILNQKRFNTINEHLPADSAVQGIMNSILECPFTGDMRIAFIREHIRALLTLQLFHFNPIVSGKEVKEDHRITKRDADILNDIRTFIDERFLDPSSLEMLSKQFGINDFKLKYGFKTLFDTSPMRYLQHKRLTYSLALLRDTDKTIKEIAHEIGYSHAANFTIAFTKTFGHTPGRYRNSSV